MGVSKKSEKGEMSFEVVIIINKATGHDKKNFKKNREKGAGTPKQTKKRVLSTKEKKGKSEKKEKKLKKNGLCNFGRGKKIPPF